MTYYIVLGICSFNSISITFPLRWSLSKNPKSFCNSNLQTGSRRVYICDIECYWNNYFCVIHALVSFLLCSCLRPLFLPGCSCSAVIWMQRTLTWPASNYRKAVVGCFTLLHEVVLSRISSHWWHADLWLPPCYPSLLSPRSPDEREKSWLRTVDGWLLSRVGEKLLQLL